MEIPSYCLTWRAYILQPSSILMPTNVDTHILLIWSLKGSHLIHTFIIKITCNVHPFFRQLYHYIYTARHRSCTRSAPHPAHQASWSQCRFQIHGNFPCSRLEHICIFLTFKIFSGIYFIFFCIPWQGSCES